MGKLKRKGSPVPPPLAAWSRYQLITLAVVLPILGTAILFGPVLAWLATGVEVWQLAAPGQSILVSVLVFGWLLVVGLWCLGFTWVLIREMRRRRHAPSAAELEQRRNAVLEEAEQTRTRVREHYRRGGWCFLLGTPGLAIAIASRWLGSDPPDWALLLSFPLTALAPLYWMQTVTVGIALWLHQGRPSRWLSYAALTLVAYVGIVWIMVFSFLRADP